MSFLGFLGSIGRMLPSYVEGERAAIKDNWQDAANYNTVLNGQLQNAYSQATFNDLVNAIKYQLAGNALNTMNAGLNTYTNMVAAPYSIPNAAQNNWLALQYNPLLWANNVAMGALQNQMYQQQLTTTQLPNIQNTPQGILPSLDPWAPQQP